MPSLFDATSGRCSVHRSCNNSPKRTVKAWVQTKVSACCASSIVVLHWQLLYTVVYWFCSESALLNTKGSTVTKKRPRWSASKIKAAPSQDASSECSEYSHSNSDGDDSVMPFTHVTRRSARAAAGGSSRTRYYCLFM